MQQVGKAACRVDGGDVALPVHDRWERGMRQVPVGALDAELVVDEFNDAIEDAVGRHRPVDRRPTTLVYITLIDRTYLLLTHNSTRYIAANVTPSKCATGRDLAGGRPVARAPRSHPLNPARPGVRHYFEDVDDAARLFRPRIPRPPLPLRRDSGQPCCSIPVAFTLQCMQNLTYGSACNTVRHPS